jgi:hypothetical protein
MMLVALFSALVDSLRRFGVRAMNHLFESIGVIFRLIVPKRRVFVLLGLKALDIENVTHAKERCWHLRNSCQQFTQPRIVAHLFSIARPV